MRHFHFVTTALISVWALAYLPAQAAEPIKLSVGGKLRHYFFIADQDNVSGERLSSTGMFTDAEVYFDGKTILDNGIEIRGVIELETEARNDRNADELYIDIISGLGKLRIGEKEGINSAMIGEPIPEALLTTDEEVIGDVIRPRTRATVKDAFTFKRYVSDNLGITYETPGIIPGVKFGVSYHPSVSDAEGPFDRRLVEHDAFDVSGRYEGKFRGGSYRVAGGYFQSQPPLTPAVGRKNQGYNLHTGVSYGGWDIAGSYAKLQSALDIDEKSWAVGVLYGIAGYKISANYFTAKRDIAPTSAAKEKVNRTNLQGSYRLGPGITVGLTGFYAEQRDLRGAQTDGVGMLGGAKLAF
ncbi:MAG: porin [Rhodospirillaceae bacterium]|nr:porin [Rhodospirillaceae bacterium]